MRRRNNFANDMLRLICFVIGLSCSGYVISGIHRGKINVTVGKGENANVVITELHDPGVFWSIVIFLSLIAVVLFYCVFFAKHEPNA
jgi:uncharacterized protein with PQ loop repeat